MRRCCGATQSFLRPTGASRPTANPRATLPNARRARWNRISLQHHATTAALIVEPLVQGATGMAMHDAHYLRRARELCTRYDVHLIADEIMTGFGRTGTMFACEQAGIVPDFLLLSKGITGGYLPLACVLSRRRDLRGVLRRRRRARLPALAQLHGQRARLPRGAGRARHLPRRRRDRRAIATRRRASTRSPRRSPAIANVRDFRRTGMIWAFEVRTRTARLRALVLRRGPRSARSCCARSATTVYFMPPYVVDDDEFALLVDATLAILDDA